ncbi:hypothetical protein PALB_25900 [Pseudoalteromonas luteoviolacea B = ATCC 29581]|nr:hypothetical protein PALB_25900 [Pseudoalteromonas luteoviolacea B = ATCC 29581]
MDTTTPSLANLFAQLGLGNKRNQIDQFIEDHKLPASTPIAQAYFWNHAQRHFIEESLKEDGAWSEIIDELDSLLR